MKIIVSHKNELELFLKKFDWERDVTLYPIKIEFGVCGSFDIKE